LNLKEIELRIEETLTINNMHLQKSISGVNDF